MFAFLSQAVTGVFLAMYYRPSATEAYTSIQHINDDVFLGLLVRGMHKWGATVMVILIFLHMGRTFVFGAYKYPRELNWIIGVMLLVPGLIAALIGAHLFLVAKLGTTAPPWLKAEKARDLSQEEI